MHLPRQPLLRLSLPSSTLHLHGTPSTAAPTLLTGRVHLDLPTSTRVASLEVTITGRLRITTPDMARPQLRSVHEDTLVLLDKSTLEAGHHSLLFEMALPGHLPSSVSTPMGVCEYRISVRLRRSVFYLPDEVIKKALTLVRHTEEEEASLVGRSVRVEGIWGNRASYVAYVPSAAYAKDDYIPVHIHFTPLRPGLHIRALDACLVEREVYGSKDPPNMGRILSRRAESVPALEEDMARKGSLDRTIWLRVPSPTTLDCDIPGFLRIRHKVEAAVRVADSSEGKGMARLTMRLPVAILPDPLKTYPDQLPRYQPPYLISPPSSSASSIHQADDEEEEDVVVGEDAFMRGGGGALAGVRGDEDLTMLMDAPPYPECPLSPATSPISSPGLPPSYGDAIALAIEPSLAPLGPC
ncbi:hypothetical protein BJ684DRAFT_21258 [Piptocephalis cylindrospora]|uniref:Arrestin C-terminal-like domain-containing protein n=1 Tax=Piptocephalis cylindrospora TaxID=1907219 RepID=A0A4P9Y106_9FUNG|nr:hypothetical protein BJ684DRAFT_21258 [Piptocephalis cylindrospora]|eukprot:RKP12182.1 hypothetical protein BJ684DRAFT_21258 [Piptocephalis cylindrospora]